VADARSPATGKLEEAAEQPRRAGRPRLRPASKAGVPPREEILDAAAGLVSNVDGMLAFGRMFLRGGAPVLTPAAVAEMTRDQLTPEQRERGAAFLGGAGWGFCTGVAVDGPRAGSFGWDGGLGTSWLVDPVRDLIVIVLTQRLFDGPLGAQLHRELQDAAYAAVAGDS